MNEELELDFDLVTVVDDNGEEHYFEELDRIETENGQKYIALLPVYDENEEIIDEDEGDVLILRVTENKNGENFLEQIEDETEFNEIGNIFEDRLMKKFEEENADKE